MPKRRVFYSFHYQNDAWRVQQIRNMGIIDGNEPVTPNDWEEIKRKGNGSIQKWIQDEISKCSCVVVLIGAETSSREWVRYEILEACKQGKALLGIYIHNLEDQDANCSLQGENPFAYFTSTTRYGTTSLANKVRCFNPRPTDAYNDIFINLGSLVEDAIAYNYKQVYGRL